MFEKLKQRYEQGRISEAMLKIYVKKKQITEEEYQKITQKAFKP